MSARYASLPTDPDRELNDAFGSDNEDDDEQPSSATHLVSSQPSSPPTAATHYHVDPSPAAAYDFERDYDYPPPGSPPRPSQYALPNDYGNNNGQLPTSPAVGTVRRSSPRPSFFRRAAGALLPQYYTQVPTSDTSSAPSRPIGGGIENDGVFANVTAKPQPGRVIQTEDGQTILIPETTQTEPLPSYLEAQADAVPPYWENVVHAPSNPSGSDILVDDLAPGSVFVFISNIIISWFFQFIGFFLTYLLHTTHAAKYGSRAGLGLTLIQYGIYSRTVMSGDQQAPIEPDKNMPRYNATMPPPTAPIPDDTMGMPSKDWISILFMTLGWFLFLTSVIGYWRVKRWEASVRSSQAQAPVTATPEQIQRDRAVRRQLQSVFGIPSGVEASRVRLDEHGDVLVIPNQEALAEVRLARDLRAAGLI